MLSIADLKPGSIIKYNDYIFEVINVTMHEVITQYIQCSNHDQHLLHKLEQFSRYFVEVHFYKISKD